MNTTHNHLSILLVLTLGVCVGCAEEKDEPSDGPAAYFVRATIDGGSFEATSGEDGEQIDVQDYTSAWTDQIVHSQSFTFNGPNRPLVRIEATGFFSSPPDQDERFQVLHVGSHDYGTLTGNREEDNVEEPGVNVLFWDGQEREWSCSTTRGDQSNSSFEVLTHDLINDRYTDNGERIWAETTGRFSCTLYSVGGSAIELTDGTFRTLSILL